MRYSGRHTVIPGPCGHPPLGIFPQLRRDPLECLTAATCRYGAVVSLPLGLRRAYLLAHPTPIRHVLEEPDLYSKGASVGRITPLFGQGLTTSDGVLWRRQRQMMQPLFQWQRLLRWTDVIAAATAEMLARWDLAAAHGQPVELAGALQELTQGLMHRVLFGTPPRQEAQAAGQALMTAVRRLDRCVWAVLPTPRWLPTACNRQFHQALHTLDAYVYRAIAEHSRPESSADDLLARLLAAHGGTAGGRVPARQLRDELVTLWVAGQTTVAAALAWTWYLLTQHPEVAYNLQGELDAVLGGRSPTPQDLPRLRYTRLVLEESLRLYPPTWVTARTSSAAAEIGGHMLPAGAMLLLSPYVLQRNPDFWEHPTRFDPERFTPARAAGRPRFTYFPFGGGPRRCIGQNLAVLEMLVILSMTAQVYEPRLVPGHPVEPEARITLRPRHGLLVTPHRRRRVP
jgi:cytochrome P450